jgi:hypothetical protein
LADVNIKKKMDRIDSSIRSATNSVAANHTAPISNAVYAKTIILGDNQSGRSELIQNLDNRTAPPTSKSNSKQYNIVIDESNFFRTIELTPHEIEYPNVTAFLKVWEYTQHLSKKDEELAFRGALFCIITFDICRVETYRSVFEKWIPLKEQLSPDSFLYIVGTHVDQFAYRQIELNDICKACAKRDALYVEVSNVQRTNFPLLRKLLCRRVHLMLEQKDFFASPTFQSSIQAMNTQNSINNSVSTGGNPSSPTIQGFPNAQVSIPQLEPNIVCSSVGAILASCFDVEEWEGYEKQEQELVRIADRIDKFVENLANTADESFQQYGTAATSLTSPSALPPNDGMTGSNRIQQQHGLTFSNKQWSADPPSGQPTSIEEEDNVTLSKSIQQLKEAFQILGLTMPESLLEIQPQVDSEDLDDDEDPFALPNSARPNLRKMQVKLPGGQLGEMVLDLESNMEQQIELFLLSNGLNYDLESRKKLLQITLKVQRDYYEEKRLNSGK